MSNDKRKRVIKALFILAVLVFICGGIVRAVVQTTGAIWLDGITGILGGLYASLLAASIIYGILTFPRGRPEFKFYIWAIPFSVLSVAVLLFGLLMIFLGASRLIASLP
jgi:hypothetical protein